MEHDSPNLDQADHVPIFGSEAVQEGFPGSAREKGRREDGREKKVNYTLMTLRTTVENILNIQ